MRCSWVLAGERGGLGWAIIKRLTSSEKVFNGIALDQDATGMLPHTSYPGRCTLGVACRVCCQSDSFDFLFFHSSRGGFSCRNRLNRRTP
jgi:hypothetical protein